MILSLDCQALAQEEPIVLDPRIRQSSRVDVDLYGYRRFPDELFGFQKGEQKGLPTQLIYAAAEQSAIVQQRLQDLGKNTRDLEARGLVQLIRSIPHDQLKASQKVIPELTPGFSIDAEFILKILTSELIDDEAPIFNGEIIGSGSTIEMVATEPDVQDSFSRLYTELVLAQFDDRINRSQNFDEITFELTEFPILMSAAKINFASASLGEIFSFPSEEKKLQIEPSVLRRYDVHWIEFPLSLRRLHDEGVRELSFHVALPEPSIALGLIPARYGVEMAVVEHLSTPEVGLEVGGASLTVGEYYGRTVEYTLLKPTIVATGLRQNKFSWFLSGEAVGTGYYLFVGIIGVPKGTDQLTIGYSVEADVEFGFLGLQGDIASTGVVFEKIELR